MGWPIWIVVLWNGLACLLSCLEMVNAGWLVLCCQKLSYKWNLSFFKAVPRNRLLFCLDSLLHIISSLFSRFCLFENAILHKMSKLGFWRFKPMFSQNAILRLAAAFFSPVLVICLSWYMHLKLSHEFLTYSTSRNENLRALGL